MKNLIIDTYMCVGCGACFDACKFNAIVLEDNAARIVVENCKRCNKCVSECPLEAISIPK